MTSGWMTSGGTAGSPGDRDILGLQFTDIGRSYRDAERFVVLNELITVGVTP